MVRSGPRELGPGWVGLRLILYPCIVHGTLPILLIEYVGIDPEVT